MKSKVDVIIPTYKPGKQFEKLICRLEKQTYQINKIIVINTETGIFPKELEQSGRILVKNIRTEEFDHGATRDMGANMSEADFVIYMTQDAVPYDSMLIEALLAPFVDDKVSATYARQLPAEDCDLIEKYTREFNYPKESCIKTKKDIERLGIKAFFCSNVCAAYRKSVYREMGGFVHKAIFNEDMIMAGNMIKSGYSVAYASEAKVIHSHNYSCIEQFHRNFDVAVSQVDYPEVFQGIHSESEGICLVKRTASFLLKAHKPWLVVTLVVKSGFKFIGYKMGQDYKKLPKSLVRKCTMNPRYWK